MMLFCCRRLRSLVREELRVLLAEQSPSLSVAAEQELPALCERRDYRGCRDPSASVVGGLHYISEGTALAAAAALWPTIGGGEPLDYWSAMNLLQRNLRPGDADYRDVAAEIERCRDWERKRYVAAVALVSPSSIAVAQATRSAGEDAS